jgi:hypothetical protein
MNMQERKPLRDGYAAQHHLHLVVSICALQTPSMSLQHVYGVFHKQMMMS